MPISKDEFKNMLSYYPSGVAIITVKSGDEKHGITVSAFSSVSAEPPLIAVFVDHRGRSQPIFQRSDAMFAVNILTEDQVELANRFAFSQEDRFAMGQWAEDDTGAPVLEDGLAWMDCTVYSRVSVPNNTIYIGEIQQARIVQPDKKPLLYWNRDYRHLTTMPEKVTEL